MPINTTKILFNLKNFENIYEKTCFRGVFYLKIKSPLATQFEVTSGCNQRCAFCYNVWKDFCSKSKSENLSKKDQFKVIDKIIENEIFDIIFSGGEPLTVPWLEKLIEKCSEKNMYITLITNAILMSDKRAKKLKEAGLNDLQISLHHFKANINDALTLTKGSFKRTLLGIKNTLKYFSADSVNVNMVALPSTYKDVYKMGKFLNSIEINSFSVGTPTASGEMKNQKSLIIDKKMFLEIYNQLIKLKRDFKMNVGFTGGFPLCILPKIDNKTLEMVGNYCDAGLNQLIIGPDGELRPCVCLGEKLGNILREDLKEIWSKNNFLINMRKLKYVPDSCKDCKYISICRGSCRASALGYYGKINAEDPLIK